MCCPESVGTVLEEQRLFWPKQMAPTNTTNQCKETNKTEITREECVPSLCSWAHTLNTIKTEQESRKMHRLI